jgi:hypothetical protein
VKKITTSGTFRFRRKLLYLANAMVDQDIGLEETDDGVWNIHFNIVLLATLDEKDYSIRWRTSSRQKTEPSGSSERERRSRASAPIQSCVGASPAS